MKPGRNFLSFVSNASTTGSISALLLANILTIFGVIFLGWDALNIVFIYWFEVAIIAGYGLLKLFTIYLFGRKRKRTGFFIKSANFLVMLILLGVLAFVMKIYLAGIFMIFGFAGFDAAGLPVVREIPFLPEFAKILPAVVSFAISHGISFVSNFLGKREFKRVSPEKVFWGAISRTWVIHVSLIAGAAITFLFKYPRGFTMVLIVAKTAFDLKAHLD